MARPWGALKKQNRSQCEMAVGSTFLRERRGPPGPWDAHESTSLADFTYPRRGSGNVVWRRSLEPHFWVPSPQSCVRDKPLGTKKGVTFARRPGQNAFFPQALSARCAAPSLWQNPHGTLHRNSLLCLPSPSPTALRFSSGRMLFRLCPGAGLVPARGSLCRQGQRALALTHRTR